MGRIDDYKPALALIGLKFGYAGINLFTRAALLKGMSSMVFVFYRQLIATLFIVSIAFFLRRGKLFNSCLGLKSFGWISLASFVGVSASQNIYTLGLYLSSSTIASAMTNLLPALTFIMATILGMEKINIKSLASLAKILGTIISVSGAISISLVKGPKLLNTKTLTSSPESHISQGGENLFVGSILLFGSSFLWSLGGILQVQVNANCPDHLSSSSWMCFFAALQSGIIAALFVDRRLEAWSPNSYLELASCFYTGIVTAVSFYIQAWCISKRGPLYSAMFQPLSTVIVAFIAAAFLHEETYTGSLVGAVAVIIGLYVVLWGKAKDLDEDMKQETDSKLLTNQTNLVQVVIEPEESFENDCKTDLEKHPLLSQTWNK